MIASLYQSGSPTASLVLAGMLVTFAAQIGPRNHRLCIRLEGKKRPRYRGRFFYNSPPMDAQESSAANFHHLTGNALPLTIALHPRVGKTKGGWSAMVS